ncbi:hypothetical protein OSTOST_05494 [Ostertagia ostertagi]
MLRLMAFLLGILPLSYALVCYESDDKGNVKEVSNDQWSYCALIPETDGEEGRVFGIGKDVESLTGYDTTFNLSGPLYKILTMCIYEKYDLGKLSPRFGQPEFLFRCVCNYDRCNSHNTFQGYLYGVQQDNL